jgi:hypothetical protein
MKEFAFPGLRAMDLSFKVINAYEDSRSGD